MPLNENNLHKLMMRFQHMLYRYIPEINHDTVWDMLKDFFTDENIVVISRNEFNLYKEYEKTLLNMNKFNVESKSITKAPLE